MNKNKIEDNSLSLPRCPHCNIADPNLTVFYDRKELKDSKGSKFHCKIYRCATCSYLVVGYANRDVGDIRRIVPGPKLVSSEIPEPAYSYLAQAVESLHAPSASIMVSASAVDAMLKAHNYKEGKLYERIEEAKKDHLITEKMSEWAHRVRLDANAQRHADDKYVLPNKADAEATLEFAEALGQYLFVLPAKIDTELKQLNQGTKT